MVQVPSGWTTSGIDWGNLRNSRTEYIVYHLHKATYERYYNYYLSTRARWQDVIINDNAPIPPQNKNFKVRTDFAIQEIRQILNRIYSIDDSYLVSSNYGRTNYYLATRCMFKKDYSTNKKPSFYTPDRDDPTNPRWQTVNYSRFGSNLGGLEPLDISQGGDLEDIAGGDLGFIRDLTLDRRLDINDLYKIYNILSTPQDCLCDTTRKDISQYGESFMMSAGSGASGFFMGDFRDIELGSATNRSGNGGVPSNINNTIDDMYSSQAEDPNNGSSGNRWGYLRYAHRRSYGWTSESTQTQNTSYLGGWIRTRVKNNSISINDIKVSYFTTAYPLEPHPDDEYYTDYGGYPLSVFGGDGTWIKRTQSFSQDNYGDYYGVYGTDKISSGIPALPVDLIQRKEIICEAHIRVMNIDSIKGLIEYYNEDSN